MEVLRGSASMLFGRGSTGGAVNQVSKTPRLIDEHEVNLTLGSHAYRRVTGDFNIQTGTSSPCASMPWPPKRKTTGQAAASTNAPGASYRWGIGERNEFLASLYHLGNNNGINYGIPFIAPYAGAPNTERVLLPLDPKAYYGMASDYNESGGTIATLAHTHRFSRDSELTTKVRVGEFNRDQRSGAIRFAAAAQQPGGVAANLTNFGPNTVLTRGTHLKSRTWTSLRPRRTTPTGSRPWVCGTNLQRAPTSRRKTDCVCSTQRITDCP